MVRLSYKTTVKFTLSYLLSHLYMEEEICLYPTNLYKYLLAAGMAWQIDKTENNKQTECYRSVGSRLLIFGQTFLNRGEREFMGE